MKSKNKQKTIIINTNVSFSEKGLNDHLDEGWLVKQIAPIGDTGIAMILIEKEEEEKKPLGFGSN